MATIAVDSGTTLVKAVMFDRDGRSVAVARRPNCVTRGPAGSSEQDMTALWGCVAAVVSDVASETREAVDVISVTGQGDGCWLVDHHGRPNGPAILWNDARATEVVRRWSTDGAADLLTYRSGNVPFAGSQPAILRWLLDHDPERLRQSHRVLYGDSWLYHCLTGRLAVERTDAASPIVDIRTGEYSPELLDSCGLADIADLLPQIIDAPRSAALLAAEAANRIGLPRGTPVVMAPFDIPAAALGGGVEGPHQASVILGTTLCTSTVSRQPPVRPGTVGMTLPFGAGFLRVMAAMTGSDVVNWAVRLLGLSGPETISSLAAQVAPGCDGVMLLPYLSAAGERAPIVDPNLRGTLAGLASHHGAEHIARAVLEGLSVVVRDCLQATGVEGLRELRVSGGGSVSDVWCQLIADVTSAPVLRLPHAELGARGADRIGRATVGIELDGVSRSDEVPMTTFEPDRALAGVYDDLYGRFVETRDRMRLDLPSGSTTKCS